MKNLFCEKMEEPPTVANWQHLDRTRIAPWSQVYSAELGPITAADSYVYNYPVVDWGVLSNPCCSADAFASPGTSILGSCNIRTTGRIITTLRLIMSSLALKDSPNPEKINGWPWQKKRSE
jgi:hypothetical protein